ncbi:endonuclease NucS domain-containing protein [Candidatus Hydrogenedentota bacterium]
MPIEVGIWKLGDGAKKVNFTPMETESKLEDILVEDLSILSPDLMLLGRQIATSHGKFIDILAMDPEGALVVVELKRNRTPREVVAQLLDYASWIQGLTYEDIAGIYAEKNGGKALEEGFAEAFERDQPDELNQTHRLIVVASELDSSTERIIGYLTENYGVPVNALFFRYFKDGNSEYLTRTWLVDPHEAKTGTVSKGREPWNGQDFYVALGEDDNRNWEDCVKYGFVSGGGGRWYTQTLKQLFPGARVFACIPKTGYVGVGTVTAEVCLVKDFTVNIDGKEIPILEAPLKATNMDKDMEKEELSEQLVRVEWEKTIPREQAYWEKGFFANQNTVCRLRNKFTLERLARFFGVDE